jgi:hypothetical protein
MSRRPAYKSRLSDYHKPLWVEFARWVVSLHRGIRIVMVFICALAVTSALSPLVDYLYLSYMYSLETRVLPSLVSIAVAVITFFFGWWMLVGTAGDTPVVRRGVVWYVIVGVAAVIWVVVLSAFGISSATLPS